MCCWTACVLYASMITGLMAVDNIRQCRRETEVSGGSFTEPSWRDLDPDSKSPLPQSESRQTVLKGTNTHFPLNKSICYCPIKSIWELGVLVHIFNPAEVKAKAGDLWEFKASLVFKLGSRIPCLKKEGKKIEGRKGGRERRNISGSLV